MSVRHRKLNAPEYGTRPVSPPGQQGLPTPGSRRSGHGFATRYRFEALAELSAELNKSSGSLRAKQLDSVGHLLGTVSPQQRYAISFVRDRIPGAEAAGSNGHGSLSGQHLIGDLVHLMEDLSSQPVVDAASLPEKVWTREQLARRLNVSMKTVSRWRRYGLVGRKVRLADGAVRTAFGESSIRRFVIQNHALVRRAAAFGS